MLELLRRAEGLAEALGDRPRLRRVYDDMSNYFRLVGDYGAAIRASERTLGLAAELGESAVAESNYNLGMACRAAGDFHRAIAALATTARLPLTEYRGPALLAVHARAWLATVLAEIGEYGEAIDEGEQGRRTAEALGNPYSHMTALYGLGVVYLAKGEFDSALPLLEHSLALCKEGAYHLLFPQVASALGVTYAASADVLAGIDLLEQALAHARAKKLLGNYSRLLSRLGEVYLAANRTDEAMRLAGEALTASRRHGERGHEAWALALLGKLHTQALRPDRSKKSFLDALALATELGMRPLVAHCHRGLGELFRRVGDRDAAGQRARTAATMYREMGMKRWVEATEA